MSDGVSAKADGGSLAARPLRCRSASALRPLRTKEQLAATSLQTRTSSSSTALAAELVDHSQRSTAWLIGNGNAAPSASKVPSHKQLLSADAVAVGTGLQAARSNQYIRTNQYRRRLAEVIQSDLLTDPNVLMQAVSRGALELPPGFARSLSPPPSLPVPKVSARQNSLEKRAPNSDMDCSTKASPLGRSALQSSRDEVASDPYLRIEPLGGWIQKSPLIRGIGGGEAPKKFAGVCMAEPVYVQGVGVIGTESQERPSDMLWRDLFDLAEKCRLPRPPEDGTPEDLKIWAIKLQERVGKKRWSAFRKRMKSEETDNSWKPSRKSKTGSDETPSKRQEIPESLTTGLGNRSNQQNNLEPSPSIENLEKAWWPELSTENAEHQESDDMNDEGDSRLDMPDPVVPIVPSARMRQDGKGMNKTDEHSRKPLAAFREKLKIEAIIETELEDSMPDEPTPLFREKETHLDIPMTDGLFPPQPTLDYGARSPKAEDAKVIMSDPTALADASLAAKFRYCVAEAWEPSNIAAMIESERQVVAGELCSEEESETSITKPIHANHISKEDVAKIYASLGGGEAQVDVSIDHLSELVCQRRVLARRDGYRRRFHARTNKSVPLNRKWSQRVSACKYSLRGLEALSEFAEYTRQQPHVANALVGT